METSGNTDNVLRMTDHPTFPGCVAAALTVIVIVFFTSDWRLADEGVIRLLFASLRTFTWLPATALMTLVSTLYGASLGWFLRDAPQDQERLMTGVIVHYVVVFPIVLLLSYPRTASDEAPTGQAGLWLIVLLDAIHSTCAWATYKSMMRREGAVLLAQAQHWFRAGDAKKAIELCQQSVRLCRTHEARGLLGRIYESLGNRPKAHECYWQARSELWGKYGPRHGSAYPSIYSWYTAKVLLTAELNSEDSRDWAREFARSHLQLIRDGFMHASHEGLDCAAVLQRVLRRAVR